MQTTQERLDAALAYWRGQLAGMPVLQLPLDRPRPVARAFRFGCRRWRLPRLDTQQLRTLGRREGVPLLMILLAAFKALLARQTGQTDIVVGMPVGRGARARREQPAAFGSNLLVLRTDLGGDPTFLELLSRVRRVVVSAVAHGDVPFAELAAQLGGTRGRKPPSLVQATVQLQSESRDRQAPVGTPTADDGTWAVDLRVTVTEKAEGLAATAEYAVDVFDAATIDRLLDRYTRLLRGIIASPHRRISALPLFPWDDPRQGPIDQAPPAAASAACVRGPRGDVRQGRTIQR